MTKYIFVCGGVISGIGKGITTASISANLIEMGFKITIKKIDPYLNVDPGTMNPYEHGEVYVTNDGSETDLDIGHYERFTGLEMSDNNCISSGRLMLQLLEKERNGKYLGKTVQLIPHFTNEIIEFITKGEEDYDFIICEIGGSVGDIEAMTFLEALRQLKYKFKQNQVMIVFITYILYCESTKELKTKPSQDAVKKLMQIGLQQDLLMCRSEHSLNEGIIQKLSLYTNTKKENIFELKTTNNIYNIPFLLKNQNIQKVIGDFFNVEYKNTDFNKWLNLTEKIINSSHRIKIGILGKYTKLKDSYYSLIEALKHSAWKYNSHIEIIWINSRTEYKDLTHLIDKSDCIVIPGGFGNSGIETSIKCIEYIRKKRKITLGICLGMQLMVIEYYRNVLGIKNAHSREFREEEHPDNIIDYIKDDKDYGGTMRLGNCRIGVKVKTKTSEIYNEELHINERHRHRYELKEDVIETLKDKTMIISGLDYVNLIPEIIEITNYKFYIGVQFHPEFKSNPFKTNELFDGFIKSVLDN